MQRRAIETLISMVKAGMRTATHVEIVGMAMPGSELPQRVRRIVDGIQTVRMSRIRVVCLIAACVATCTVFATGALERARQSQAISQWQIDAGGKMTFDVASVKQNTCGLPPSCLLYANINLLPGDQFAPTGGLFTETNWYVMPLIVFAYKLNANHYQLLTAQLPKWANAERFDVEARASGNPTKDQYRLMMQALLADRFKLVVHYETRQLPVFALVLDKPGKLGPTLRPHSDGPPCPSDTSPAMYAQTVEGGYPAVCDDAIAGKASAPGRIRQSARNVSMERIGTRLGPMAQVGRPIVDQTGLKGNFEYIIEWTPGRNNSQPPSTDLQPEPSGPTFLEALKDQLGLKLVPTTGPVEVLVIDRIEEPSPN